MSFPFAGFITAGFVAGCLACGSSVERVSRLEAYNHVFEVVALVPDPKSGRPSAEIMRLRLAGDTAAADLGVSFLPPESTIDSLVETIAAGSEGDYSQSLQATRMDRTTWELTLSTGGNTTRDVSTYRTDGRTIAPVAYERHAVMSRARRYVYSDGVEAR
jgi:hypothetical protein